MSLRYNIQLAIARSKKPVVYKKGETGNLHWWMIDAQVAAEEVMQVLDPPLSLQQGFKKWCKLTERSGGVLLGKSIREFFDWYEQNKYNETI